MDLVGQDDVRRRHWVNDIDVSNCHGCNEPFNPIGRRRHHCRQCGEVVCAECSSVRVPLPEKFGYGLMKVRVCDSCVMKGAHPEMQELDDQLVIRERINKSLKEALKDKSQALERCKSLLLQIDSSAKRIDRLDSSTRRKQQLSSDGGSDDEIDSEMFGIESLLQRCEISVRDLSNALESSEESRLKLEAIIKKLESSHQTKDQSTIELKRHIYDLEKELQIFQQVSKERDTFMIQLENQDRELVEQRTLVKGLERRCRLLETSTASTGNTLVQPTVFGKERIKSQRVSQQNWGPNDLQEPLIHIYSDGGDNDSIRQRRRFQGLTSAYLRNRTSTTSSLYRCLRWFCCCRRRRRTRNQLAEQLVHESISSDTASTGIQSAPASVGVLGYNKPP